MSSLALCLGLFYVFAGVVVLRRMREGRVMDEILAQLEGQPAPVAEQIKDSVLHAGAFLTLTSGVALAALSALALPLFVANTLVQGGYLVWASRALPPQDEDDHRGRNQTANAFFIYGVVCLIVIGLESAEHLRPWPLSAVLLATEGLLIAAGVLAGWALSRVQASWFSRGALPEIREGDASTQAFEEERDEAKAPRPVNIRLAPEWLCWPIWDADTGDNVSYHRLGLPDDLVERIQAWDEGWQETYNADDPMQGGYASDEVVAAYMEEGRQIAAALTQVWPGRVTIPDEFR